MTHTYKYPRPALTVDCVIFGLDATDLKLLLIERKHDPFAGCWALPGGFLDVGESPLDAAKRELEEETSLTGIEMRQFGTFGEPDRDPREHVVSVAHYAVVNVADCRVEAADDARDARWFSVAKLPDTAFDHEQIIAAAHRTVRERLQRRPFGLGLLPPKFTLQEIQRLYETILKARVDSQAFRRRIMRTGLLAEMGKRAKTPGSRTATLYRFDRKTYRRLERRGLERDMVTPPSR